MTLNEMRVYILQQYPNATSKWRHKVTTMKPDQVIAIYHSILERQHKKRKKPVKEKYHQIDIFEWVTATQEKGSHTDINV